MLLEQIKALSSKYLAHTSHAVIGRWWVQLTRPPYALTALKVVSLPMYAFLFGVGFLTSSASVIQLIHAKYSQAFSSNVSTRIDFANTFTNVGALFACVTDLPAITYVVYLLNFSHIHRELTHETLMRAYHDVMQDEEIDIEVRRSIYDLYLQQLMRLGIDRFYLLPDVRVELGAFYQEQASALREIDEEIERQTSLQNCYRDVLKHLVASMRQKSCAHHITNIALGLLCFSTWALSALLLIENGVLLKDSKVGDLFSSNRIDQDNEAFLITQIGGAFSALTAFGSAGYIAWIRWLKQPYHKTMKERIFGCFQKYTQEPPLPEDKQRAWQRICDLKLSLWS